MSLHPRPSCASHPGIKLKRVSTEEAISFPSGLMYELPRHSRSLALPRPCELTMESDDEVDSPQKCSERLELISSPFGLEHPNSVNEALREIF